MTHSKLVAVSQGANLDLIGLLSSLLAQGVHEQRPNLQSEGQYGLTTHSSAYHVERPVSRASWLLDGPNGVLCFMDKLSVPQESAALMAYQPTQKWAAHNETLATHRRARYDGIRSTYSATLHASTCIKDGDSTAEDKTPFDGMVDQAGSGAISEARHPTH